MILAVFLSVGCVCASDVNETITQTNSDDSGVIVDDDSELGVSENDDDELESGEIISTSSKISSDSTYMKGSQIDIQILDGNKKGIANKTVYINYRNALHIKTTDANGYVHFKLQTKGTYALNYIFNETGYAPINKTKTITVVDSTKVQMKGYTNYAAYVGFKNSYRVIVSANGTKLPNKKVKFTINGKTYTKTTNQYGHAYLNINLKKGTYTIRYSFAGDSVLKSASGSSKVIVKQRMPVKIEKLTSIVFQHKKSTNFQVKILDARGNPISNKNVVLELKNIKKLTAKTNKNGIATFRLNLYAGSYKLIVTCAKTNSYDAAKQTYNAVSRTCTAVNNGFWLFGSDMKKVDLNKMAKYGTKHIFLNSYAITLHGKADVAKFVKTANSLGIKVHIWMQVFNDGEWINPVTSSGKYKYSLFNSIISEAKKYAAIEGVAGIHFDYLRYPGTAYKYSNGVGAINYFTKQACEELHKMNPKLIISAAVMPEPSSMKYYYGQDIPTLSKYLDVIIPMIYKGNYGQGTSWIKSTTEAFKKMSNGAQVWTGLQSYYSDDNVKNLPASSLMNDARSASFGGATGVILFRYGLFDLINFNNI